MSASYCATTFGKQKNCATINNTGVTRIKVKEFSYKWIIENFHHFVRRLHIDSPEFTIGDQSQFTCDLNMRESKDPNYFSVFPYFCGHNIPGNLHVIISILNDLGKEAFVKRFSVDQDYNPINNSDEYFDKFIAKDYIFDEKNKLLPNGILTIVCKMCIYEGVSRHSDKIEQEIKKAAPNGYLEHFDDFEQLLENNTFSDFKIIVSHKEFPVNKCILAARSRVFAAMLEHNTKESCDGQVEINDIEPEVMQEMLRFIYSGKVNDIEEKASDLLVAAEKYELEGLKSTCQEILIKKLSLENVDEALVLVDKISVEKLKTATIEFIIENSKALNGSETFKKAFKSLSSSFLTDVTHALMMKL